MSRSLRIYGLLESILGRKRLYRVGRFLYQGARRELLNDPNVNGEYALQRWATNALLKQNLADRSQHKDENVHIFDVGANLGDWTTSFLSTIQSQIEIKRISIHAFEPAPQQADAIEEKFRTDSNRGAVYVCRKAVGASESVASFIVTGPRAGNNAIQTTKSSIQGHEIRVPVTTLDSYASETGVEQILIAKVDTEGNDFNVIIGATSLFESNRIAVLQFEYNWRWIAFGYWLKSAFDFTKSLPGYAFGQLTSSGIEVHDEWNPEMERYIETNYVIVRRDFLKHIPHSLMKFDESNTPVNCESERT